MTGHGSYHCPVQQTDCHHICQPISPRCSSGGRAKWTMDDLGQGHWLSQLFREVSAGFESSAILKVLNEWINSGIADRIRSAAFLVLGAGPPFVFKHVGFTSNLLERAYAASYDCYQSVSGSLSSSALSGTRSGTPGQTMPEDVALRDQASAVAGRFDAGSPTSSFYAWLA